MRSLLRSFRLLEAEHCFHFQILIEAVRAVFAAIARALVAAERRIRIPRWMVDVDLPRAYAKGDRTSRREACTLNVSAESVDGVVRDLDGLIHGPVGHDAKHRPEDLFLCDAHPGVHLREDRRPHIETSVLRRRSSGTAADELGAVGKARSDHLLHTIELRAIRHRAEHGLLRSRIADHDRLGSRRGELLDLAET